jgi:hypothetical protein
MSSTGATVDLMVEEFLNVVDGEEMFAVHRDIDDIPILGNKDLEWMG